LYFEVASTLALGIGLVVANVTRPGSGMNIDPATLNSASISSYTHLTQQHGVPDFFMNIVPNSVAGALAAPFVDMLDPLWGVVSNVRIGNGPSPSQLILLSFGRTINRAKTHFSSVSRVHAGLPRARPGCPRGPQLRKMRSVGESRRQHSVEFGNRGIHESNPQGCLHEGIS
jgi:hypothetical protein